MYAYPKPSELRQAEDEVRVQKAHGADGRGRDRLSAEAGGHQLGHGAGAGRAPEQVSVVLLPFDEVKGFYSPFLILIVCPSYQFPIIQIVQ